MEHAHVSISFSRSSYVSSVNFDEYLEISSIISFILLNDIFNNIKNVYI